MVAVEKAGHTDHIDPGVAVVDKAFVVQEPLERLVVDFGMVAVQMEVVD